MNSRFSLSDIAVPLALILLGLMLLTHRLPAQTHTPTRFTVVEAGTAGKPDIILIPGLDSSRSVWDAEAKLLSPNYRLHLLQVNGFAGQPAGPNATGALLPAATEELDTYILRSKMHPAVIGHSLGGMIALMLAEKHPDAVRKLVILDELPFNVKLFGPDATTQSVEPKLETMRHQMQAMSEKQYLAMMAHMATAMVTDVQGQRAVAAAFAASDRTVSIQAMIEDSGTDLRPGLVATSTPTLLLYPVNGSQGALEVDALYRNAYKPMPNVTLQRIDNSRHFIMYDQPAAFGAAVEAFLK